MEKRAADGAATVEIFENFDRISERNEIEFAGAKVKFIFYLNRIYPEPEVSLYFVKI